MPNPSGPDSSGAGERTGGHPYGLHRVRDKVLRLPQAAEHLDNSLPIFENEILIEVERLNIDAASFVQMEAQTKGSPSAIGQIILDNCNARGKQQNQVTGSGGMLIGTVANIGSKYPATPLKKGDRVATLVSLSLTPLHLEKIVDVNLKNHQVTAPGHAVLFEHTIVAKLPNDMPENVAMAAFDVAGAPATVSHLCQPGQTAVIIGGGGKAGLLSCVAARQAVGKTGSVIAIEPFEAAAEELRGLGVCDEVLQIDATDPIAVESSVTAHSHGKMGDVVVNVASVAGTETSALLCAAPSAKVLFFSMATQFTRVALGAEGLACQAELLFGNGYFPGHSETVLDILRTNSSLRALFEKRYS